MKQPSVHVTKEVFMAIFQKLGKPLDEDFTNRFFKEARGYAINTRSVIQGNNKKTRKKLEVIQSSSLGDAQLLSDIIYATRIKMKHTGVTKIKQTDSQWSKLKELVPRVNDFCIQYSLEKRAGYIAFVEKGLNMLASTKRRVPVSPVIYLYGNFDKVMNQIESEYIIGHDQNPGDTKYLYEAYNTRILERTGINNQYDKNPLEYVFFVYARELADSLNVDYDTFIDAQFEALSFCNGIPKPEDLTQEKARERLIRYVSKYNIQLNSNNNQEDQSIDWSAFK